MCGNLCSFWHLDQCKFGLLFINMSVCVATKIKYKPLVIVTLTHCLMIDILSWSVWISDRESERREEGGGKVVVMGGEAREQVFPQADQEYSAHIAGGYRRTPCVGSALSATGHTQLISGPWGWATRETGSSEITKAAREATQILNKVTEKAG